MEPKRPLLYLFQHVALREAAFENHPELIRELAEPPSRLPLLHFWSRASLQCERVGPFADDPSGENDAALTFHNADQECCQLGPVTFDALNAPRAISACELAIENDPADRQLAAYLCRALFKAQRPQDALARCWPAADGASQASLGGTHLAGAGTEAFNALHPKEPRHPQ